jgi:hypothetical protein
MNTRSTTYVILICASLLFFFSACSDEENYNKLSFDNNIECTGWSTSGSTIPYANAHSGNYVCKIDKNNSFSTMLDIKVKDISKKPLKRAKITAWFMLTSHDTEQNLVLDVRDSTLQNSFEWIKTDAADYTNDLNKWTKAELIVDLTKKDRNNVNNIYRIYAANGKNDPVYVDDFEVSFEE